MDTYLLVKTLHVVAVISWMAGMLYLPRLYVYHVENWDKPDMRAVFCVMEHRLLRWIINPAMIVSFLAGIAMVEMGGVAWREGWFEAKLLLLLFMTILHGFLARWRKQLARGECHHSAKFYRIINEVVTLLMVGIVYFVIVRPAWADVVAV